MVKYFNSIKMTKVVDAYFSKFLDTFPLFSCEKYLLFIAIIFACIYQRKLNSNSSVKCSFKSKIFIDIAVMLISCSILFMEAYLT